MPLPTPQSGESQKDFIDRCMADEVMEDEYPDDNQRIAVCYAQWKGNKAAMNETLAVLIEASRSYDELLKIFHLSMARLALRRIEGDTPAEWAARKVSDDAGAIISDGLELVDGLAEDSDSLSEMRDDLFGLYPMMPFDDLADTMSEAMIAARLAGMWEIENGD